MGGATDYICRDTTNPSQDSFLIPCGLKWYDEKLGGGSGWVNPTTKESDYLKTIEVDSGGATNRVELNFKPFPFKSNFLDSNFDVKDNVLAFGGDNEVRFSTFTKKTKYFTNHQDGNRVIYKYSFVSSNWREINNLGYLCEPFFDVDLLDDVCVDIKLF